MSDKTEVPANDPSSSPTRPGRRRRLMTLAGILLALYQAAAYVIVPFVWERYVHNHPTFDDDPRITRTHHVRFWRTPRTDDGGREIWIGSAS